MTQAGDKFRKELDMFLLKEGSDITQEDWISKLLLIGAVTMRRSVNQNVKKIATDRR